jgi:SAM-dependent methyltransferase
MTMDRKHAILSREQWQANLAAEARHWETWLRDAGTRANEDAAADLQWRTSTDCDVKQREMFEPYLRPACPPGSQARILDVGAGPLTWFPRKWFTRDFTVTPIDPLAGEFDAMLQRADITPHFRTIKGEAETLSQQFAEDRFHMVFCRNALEQFRDPLTAIGEMLKVVKPGCWVILLQEDQRTDDQSARGPWTIEEADADLFLNVGNERVDLGMEFADVATVRAFRSWHWPWVFGGLKKETLGPSA